MLLQYKSSSLIRTTLLAAAITSTVAWGCASGGSGPAATTPPAIPRQVGLANLTRTQATPRGDAGTMYRYRDGRFRPDVFVYPKGGAPDVRTQAYDFIETLKFMRVFGRSDAFRVLLDEPVSITANQQAHQGHEIVAQVLMRGQWNTTYFAVVALPEQYIKFRITQPLGSEAVVRSRDFVRDWLTAYSKDESK